MSGNDRFEHTEMPCFLFIYLVKDAAGAYRYCSVVSYGSTLQAAEQIAINRVHQNGLHIARTDTATPAPWLDPARDAVYLDELSRFGCALQLLDQVA